MREGSKPVPTRRHQGGNLHPLKAPCTTQVVKIHHCKRAKRRLQTLRILNTGSAEDVSKKMGGEGRGVGGRSVPPPFHQARNTDGDSRSHAIVRALKALVKTK